MKSNQCIVDWRPFDEYTIDSATPIGVNFNMTFKLELAKDGTHLINWCYAPASRITRKQGYGRSTRTPVFGLLQAVLRKV